MILRQSAVGQEKAKTIIGIFAHPDDENMLGAVFAKYARLGHKVYVIIATDGKDGTRYTNLPAGDSVGKIRQMESICACEKLGISPPIFLHIDKLDTRSGVRPYLNGRKTFLEELKKHIQRLNPDILLTFGPDGENGHAEHIVAGSAVSQLLLQEGWVDKYPLYFAADTKEEVADNTDVGYVDRQYMNVKISFSDEDEKKVVEAARCYVSQASSEQVKALSESITKDKSNRKYFRKFYVTKGQRVKSEFWDKK